MSHRKSLTPDRAETTGASEGPVVLDIGGDIGALVVRTSDDLEGVEIEIRCLPEGWKGTHVAVRARPAPGPAVYAAVFAQLREGSYELRQRPALRSEHVHHVDVLGGKVVETTWPDSD
jgi:hypothetical protein